MSDANRCDGVLGWLMPVLSAFVWKEKVMTNVLGLLHDFDRSAASRSPTSAGRGVAAGHLCGRRWHPPLRSDPYLLQDLCFILLPLDINHSSSLLVNVGPTLRMPFSNI